MEEFNEETLEQVNEVETDAPVDAPEEEAIDLPVDTDDDDVDADDVDTADDNDDDDDDIDDDDDDDDEDGVDDETESEAAPEPVEQPDRNRDALRKFAEVHQLLSIFHQRATQHEYRDRGRILGLLNLKDGIETRNIMQVLDLRKSDLNAVLDKLENEGLINRVWGDEEKRWATISLTEEGRAAKIPSGRITDFAFEGFEDEELEAFIANLERIVKNVEAELGEDAQKLLKEHRPPKPAGKPEDARGRGGRGGHDDRGRGDRGGFRKHDDRGRDGFRKRDDRGGRDGFRKHDDRGGRGGFDRDRGGRGGFDRDRGPRREDRGGFGRDNSKRGGGFGGRGEHGGFGGGRGRDR